MTPSTLEAPPVETTPEETEDTELAARASEVDKESELQQAADTIIAETVAPIVTASQEALTFEPIGGGVRTVNRVHKRTGVKWVQYRGNPTSFKVASGILWIPPFVGPSPFPQKQKKVVCKHKCPDCGALHNDRRKKG